ncbi:restriction endonuclease [Kribbella sp.]|uniref:restriction endonuclease n=1 Tax=Kribbella sp. TaxID=1871183 RepID=UPI002D4D5894|nr:restriction endonuclease [Kribbella sp.]HZX03284.1 restriction endonuclease [Kribbella sp.]
MGRRRGFFAEMEHQRNLRVKQAAREQRERERLIAQAQRERERATRAAAQADKQAAKEAAARYLQVRQAEVAAMNEELAERMTELEGLLTGTLGTSARIPFAALRRQPEVSRFDPGPDGVPAPPPVWAEFAPPPAGAVQRMFKKQAIERTLAERQAAFAAAQARHQADETSRMQRLQQTEQRHRAQTAAARQRADDANAKVDAFEQAYRQGRPEAVNDYLELTLEARPLPTGFPSDVEVAYQAENRRLMVVQELPGVEVIPADAEYKYIRTKDEITPRARPPREINQRYGNLVAQLVLRTMRDAFDVAGPNLVTEVAVSALVSTRNKATGRPERPCLVSLMTTREQFGDLVLSELDPTECLRHLNALVSKHPWDLEAVRPVFDPDLSRYKFVDARDAAAGLDGRRVLVELDPTEFEHLVRQLFEAMGMKAWVTQASRDDGVDGVAVNEDPVMGGVCVIQAKRYRGVVSTEAVRALAGTMGQLKASRGVLVTTSWFGKQSHDFAAEHGRIQLIEGPHLKQMLKEHLGLDVIVGELKGAPRRL